MRRVALIVVAALVAAVPLAADAFPKKIALPNGFQPEGIAVSSGGTFYVGSIPTGAIYRGDLRTGTGSILVPGTHGRHRRRARQARPPVCRRRVDRPCLRLRNRLRRALLASYQLTAKTSFINDVVVTKRGAYFTDSTNAFPYRIPTRRTGPLARARRRSR